jgi:hypothetical protein
MVWSTFFPKPLFLSGFVFAASVLIFRFGVLVFHLGSLGGVTYA